MSDPNNDRPEGTAPGSAQNEPGATGPAAAAPQDDWASALAEQTSQEARAQTQADGLKSTDDWASALAEQTGSSSAASPSQAAGGPQPAGKSVFQPLSGQPNGIGNDIDMIMDVPVQLTVELGRTRLTIKNLLQLGQGSVVELDNLAGEPMDIYVNGYLIAQGEVVVVEDRYGIRLTDIITPSERLNRLNSRR